METIIRLLVNSQGLKLIRHGLAAASGWLAAQGFAPEGGDITQLAVAAVLLAVSVFWSLAMKSKPSDSTMDIARTIVAALASQASSWLAALLAARGYQGDLAADNVLYFLLVNIVNSMASKPDASEKKKKGSLARAVLHGYIAIPFVVIALLQHSITPSLLAAEPSRCNSCVAIQVKPSLTAQVARLWSKNDKLWPQRSTIRIRFLDGSATQQRNAWREFAEIDALVNLTFVKVTSDPSEMRVSFSPGQGHWSYVGTDCLKQKAPKATMNIDLGRWEFRSEWRRVAQHELMHGIGFEHEHQSPLSSIPWDKAAVYAYYGQTQGWSKSQIDFQVLNRYSGTNWQGTSFDKDSIMQYPVPGELTNFKLEVGWNSKRSAADEAELKRRYPQ